ncbi:TrbC/VirB2 family protein [Neorhizobium sp. T786]|uniref:TrbC/VirB2 family protein n=1 Tax=Pseudorhizobium xiangyangii TaxID=2883104 RepID=UPI001CFFA1EB|nr:TrbC/VirB2 family protein [Neorhizobium xiangyangii]MCB5205160.1 TrbC/VirB2 family protein [Neorhizobium xiangyangii]
MSFQNSIGAVAKRHAPALAMAAVMSVMFVEPAFAQSLGNIEKVLKNLVDILTGEVARLIAMLAVILLGMATMFNMFDKRNLVFVILGIAIVFGAAEIVGWLTGA